MNKTELVAAVAEKSALTKKDAAAAIDAVFAVIGDTLQAKQKVQLIGFGTFQTSERKARTGKNPQTGAAIKIAASTVPTFKAGKALKEKVNTKPAKKGCKKK
ncbi:MAG: HU family DNA-binding protein [Lachnospiraceae bacterium]|nr:HU family DNA-binding protein [Lachnospiraceae bacterium]